MADGQMYAPIHDLIQTIEVFCRYAFRSRLARQIGGAINSPLMELLIARSTRDGERFIAALKRYTELVQGARAKGRITRRCTLRELPFELVCHITYQVYSRIVAPQVESLQNYKGR
jgi:H3 lysine-79-specific histone-lysine N-methyltransferase